MVSKDNIVYYPVIEEEIFSSENDGCLVFEALKLTTAWWSGSWSLNSGLAYKTSNKWWKFG